MALRNYRKSDPTEDSVAPREELVTVVEAMEPSAAVAATDYSKAEGVEEPVAFVVVFSNGEVRERNYFRWMQRNCQRLKLEFHPVPISPDDLLVEAVKKKAEYMLTTDEAHPDLYYTVTDVDHFYNDILRSRDGYEKAGIRLIVSNPCFEVWLYYSRREDRFEGFVMPEERLRLSQVVKRFVNEKIPGGVNPLKAVFDIRRNIAVARANYGEDENEIPVLFATNMFVIAEELLPYIDDDIEAWQKKMAALRK